MSEEFKQIMNTDLEVSKTGIIRNIKTKKNYLEIIRKTGYCHINHSVKTLRPEIKTSLIHRLVYYTYNDCWDTYSDKDQVDHIDRDKTNNNLENLRFVSISTNTLNKDKYSVKILYNKQTETVIVTDNIMEFSRRYGIQDAKIYALINGRSKSYHSWVGTKLESYRSDKINFLNYHKKEDFPDEIASMVENSKPKKRTTIPKDTVIEATNIKNGKVYMFKYGNSEEFCAKFDIQKRRLTELIRYGNTAKGFRFTKVDSPIEIKDSIVEI